MEIITYVLEGALRHDDSTGGGGVLKHHDVQVMTAGSGITHSEKNASTTEPLHLLQIWVIPSEEGLPPAYSDRRFDPAGATDQLQTLASLDGRDGSLVINQDATLARTLLSPGAELDLRVETGHRLWLQIARGGGAINETRLEAGDAASADTPGVYRLSAGNDGIEALVFDLP